VQVSPSSLFEVSWYQIANQHVPGTAPRILAHDEKAKLFAIEVLDMEVLDPKTHKLWKNELRDGRVDPQHANHVGATRLSPLKTH